MTMRNNAVNNIRRYGSKGRAVLVRVANSFDPTTLENTTTESETSLLAFVGSVEREEIPNDVKMSVATAVMAVPDADFDGIVGESDQIKVDGKLYSIIDSIPNYVFGELNYVRMVCVG